MFLHKCAVCGKSMKLKRDDIKYIIEEEDFVCSPKCITKWIVSLPITDYHFIKHRFNSIGAYTFKSNFERNIAVFLKCHNFHFQYEEFGFNLGKCTYTPDFFLPTYKCFLETKGLWGVGGKKKMKLFRKRYPGVKLLIIPWIIHNEFSKYKLEDFK